MLENLNQNRKKIYWLSQISGWGTFLLFNLLASISFDDFNLKRFGGLIYFFIIGLAFTHIYRGIIKKNKLTELPAKKVIILVLLSSGLIGLLIMIFLIVFSNATGLINPATRNIGFIIVGWINASSVIVIWSLIYFAVHYFENFKKAEIERLIWEAAVKDFELKTLKSQLNPHFMFNALNSIRALIEENPAKAKTAITLLSNIFRYSLKIERTETIALEDEMQTVSDYLTLEQIRFEERLKFNVEFSNDIKFVEIPPMMIQTLVENGIKHGVSKIQEGGIIEIRASKQNQNLEIKIRNSGYFSFDEMNRSDGYGISNTKQRLNLIYGENATLSIKNIDNFVEAIINIPIGDKNESNNN
jgi:sensor histidine kinase YesM